MTHAPEFLKPFSQVDASRLARLDGVVFDIDDTITRNGELEPAALSALHALSAAGLTLVAVTGRPLGWADVLAKLLPVAVAVGENGAGWVVRCGEALRPGYFAPEQERVRQAALLARIRERVAREMPEVRVTGDLHLRRCDLTFDSGETVHMSAEAIAALVALIESEGAASSVSSVHTHAIPGRWNKASGTVRALAELGIDADQERDRWLFIGDSGNDAEAFAFFPLSVGVANVEAHRERLRHLPRYITRADRGRGFAEMAAQVLALRA